MKQDKKTLIIFVLIVILAACLRFYRFDSVPPALTWDEVDAGYNAWTIANYGRDEWGEVFPLVFNSFGDDKHPVHIYLTAAVVKVFGSSDFTTRLPAVLLGIGSVILIYFLTKIMFKSNSVSLLSASFLAISPYHLHFSRFNHEANYALFFFMLGLLFFYMANGKKNLLIFSATSFLISLLSYHSSIVIVPITVVLLLCLYFKDLILSKIRLLLFLLILSFFVLLSIFNPGLLGLARIKQTSVGSKEIEANWLYKRTNNQLLGKIGIASQNYLAHYDFKYLFISGDKNPRLSSQVSGEFYIIDSIFLIAGLFYLLIRFRKENMVLLIWAFVAPIPASFSSEAPHAARALFMMGSWNIIAAVGCYAIWILLKHRVIRIVYLLLVAFIMTVLFRNYITGYYSLFAKNYSHDFQYGMKQIVEYVKEHPEYSQVFMTNERGQPYIFFLYYLNTPLPDFLNTAVYNRGNSKSFSKIDYFGRYYFENWDPIESRPLPGVLYIVTPSQYVGLRHRLFFDVKKQINYPNGQEAFFMVSADK